MKSLQVRGAPNFYQCEEGILQQLPVKLSEQKLENPAIIHGEKSWEAAKDYISLDNAVVHVPYKGDCTHEEVARVADKLRNNEADAVIGVGGGKVLDLAKAAGDELDLPVILIPTLASNCSPWTPLSVFYDGAGNFLHYIVFSKTAHMVLIEPRIIADSPVEYLRAGIGDTIAKWYEAVALTDEIKQKPLSLDIALHAARLCRDVLLDKGTEAIESVRNHQVTPALVKVAETIMMAGGMVGGYGDEYGRIAGAHAIHNGLTTIPETHKFLHGDKVAYGILVQLALENKYDEVTKLLPYYKELNLPTTLAELGIQEHVKEAIDALSEKATIPEESIHLMSVSTTKDDVIHSIQRLEEYVVNHITPGSP
ncbi:iron-containing alcohol dehydrogenase family protein [Salinibacillus aidingensis]|uniref:Iron-containing alcohol dehydrogenase family protein n=1 Tax=Salinibacillus aidingensis TaxID=237684 RepID=A0ABN1AXB3_9BACI